MESEKIKSPPHNLIMEGRKKLIISGVKDMDSFDENQIILYTVMGELLIKGKKLQINSLDVETGEFSAEGEVIALVYSQNRTKVNIFAKLFR